MRFRRDGGGEVVIVFDPKGDVDLLRRVYAEAVRSGRAEAFFMFHLGHPERAWRAAMPSNPARARLPAPVRRDDTRQARCMMMCF